MFHEHYCDDDEQLLEMINVTMEQFIYDQAGLFGAIIGILLYQVASTIVHQYTNTNNDIAVFIAILMKYGG